MNKPLVSVCCITYNHEKYIRDAIEGFLMQKTTIPIEILIHDDASTDGTADIIKEYEAKCPDIIKPIYQTENQYSKGINPYPVFVYPRARGKYIALCEGDDYWIDPYKLQKQVDFLEANPDCSLCFHASKHIYAKNPARFYIQKPKPIPADKKFDIKDAILGGGGFMATNSMVFLREYIIEPPEWMAKAPVGDLPLMLILASRGKMAYIDEIMSVYRIMTENSWSMSTQNKEKSKEHHYAVLKMWDDFDKWTDKKYHYLVFRKKMKNRCYYLRSYLKRMVKEVLR